MPALIHDTPEMLDKYGDMKLDAILELEEPELSRAKRAWVEAGLSDPEGGLVKLVTSNRKPLRTKYADRKGNFMEFGHQGKKVARTVALELMRDYGAGGTYYLRDQASGYTQGQWRQRMAAKPQEMEQYGEPDFITNYLTHDTGDQEGGAA